MKQSHRFSEADASQMIFIYENFNLGSWELAKIFDCTVGGILYHLNKHGLEIRGNNHNFSEAELGQMIFMYENLFWNTLQIAKAFNCSGITIQYHLKKHNIKMARNRHIIKLDENYYLGCLCKHGHEYQKTRKSLKYIRGRGCIECVKERSKKCYRNNKEKITKQHRRYEKKRYEEDPIFRLRHSISSALRQALCGKKAGRHWEGLVGYTLEELKTHLESRFTLEMIWQNYGSYWEIDHIIPINLFNFQTVKDSEFNLCWSLNNLRPFLVKENRRRPRNGSDLTLAILKGYELQENKYMQFLPEKVDF